MKQSYDSTPADIKLVAERGRDLFLENISLSFSISILPSMEEDEVGTELFLYIDSSTARRPVQYSPRELCYADCPISRAFLSALRVRFPGLRRFYARDSLKSRDHQLCIRAGAFRLHWARTGTQRRREPFIKRPQSTKRVRYVSTHWCS